MTKLQTVLGLMSGTSMDGIDVAAIETDGENAIHALAQFYVPYDTAAHRILETALTAARNVELSCWHARDQWPDAVRDADQFVTEAHGAAVAGFQALHGLNVELVGFHGHTVLHRPDAGITVQIGDPQALAQHTGCPVIGQFRQADVAQGGQGAPLAPLFHRARATGLARPVAVLNLGGVGNITVLGADGQICAFDTGPGNALIDDWVRGATGARYDEDGALAARGLVDGQVLAQLMTHPFFDLAPPKSLDRLAFDPAPVAALSAADGAATLTAFTAASVARALEFFEQPPERLIVCGGGRHNAALMRALGDRSGVRVENCDALGWAGDALEAEAFAWLAARHVRGLPTSVSETTGVVAPTVGGQLFQP